MSEQSSNVGEIQSEVMLGNGAQFWVYLSPQNNSAQNVTEWSVTFSQGSWSETISSANPKQILQTPGLSGVFQVSVIGSGPNMPHHQLQPLQGSKAEIGCNENCAAMVGIVATPGGFDANYWTTWDAFCNQ